MIMIDIDGVLADFCLGFTKLAKELDLVERPWTTAEQSDWNMPFRVDPVWVKVAETPNWWMTLERLVTDEEVNRINDSLRYGREIAFVTQRGSGKEGDNIRTRGLPIVQQTSLWLESMGIDLDAPGNRGVYAVRNKARWAVENGVTLALDDKPLNLHLLDSMDIQAVARRWRYNDGYNPSVTSLKEFLDYA